MKLDDNIENAIWLTLNQELFVHVHYTGGVAHACTKQAFEQMKIPMKQVVRMYRYGGAEV